MPYKRKYELQQKWKAERKRYYYEAYKPTLMTGPAERYDIIIERHWHERLI
jgi:hypothetical protein